MIRAITDRWKKNNFLLEELVKRDFNARYKRTVLGVLWSMLGPLLQLLVMTLVFSNLFGNEIENFIIFVFSGMMIFNFFSESTNHGMMSLMSNGSILTKIKVPKYLFLLSKNIAMLINFGLLLIIYFLAAAISGVSFHLRFVLLVYPIITIVLFNIGMGLVLSALFVFFKDIQYLYSTFTMIVMWLSAIFYDVTTLSVTVQRLFLLNPVFTHIHYFRLIVLYGVVPAWHIHLALALYASVALGVGAFFYKKFNYKFIYYM